MNKYIIPIGDWSEDGHGMFKTFIVEVNKTKKETIDFIIDNYCDNFIQNLKKEQFVVLE